LLAQMGLVRTDPNTGRPVMVVPSAGAGAAPAAPAAASTPSVWTSDQVAAAAAEPATKSKLWLPGMD
jgi:hypothetical protein